MCEEGLVGCGVSQARFIFHYEERPFIILPRQRKDALDRVQSKASSVVETELSDLDAIVRLETDSESDLVELDILAFVLDSNLLDESGRERDVHFASKFFDLGLRVGEGGEIQVDEGVLVIGCDEERETDQS